MIDEDGWLHTGDIGALDDDGFLTITGRKKDLIVTAAGKNVAPTVLEDRLRAHWLVSECLVVGDGRPYIAALITGDAETLAQWKTDNHKPDTATVADLRDDPDLRAEFQSAIDEANKAVSQAEAIRKFMILDQDFTEAGGQLTPTMKVRRQVITEQYAVQIATLYGDGARLLPEPGRHTAVARTALAGCDVGQPRGARLRGQAGGPGQVADRPVPAADQQGVDGALLADVAGQPGPVGIGQVAVAVQRIRGVEHRPVGRIGPARVVRAAAGHRAELVTGQAGFSANTWTCTPHSYSAPHRAVVRRMSSSRCRSESAHCRDR